MKEAGRGSIINISSIRGWPARLLVMLYRTQVRRAGLKSTALEVGVQQNSKVSSIHPGLVKTPMTDWV